MLLPLSIPATHKQTVIAILQMPNRRLKGSPWSRGGHQAPVCQIPKCKPPDTVSVYFMDKTEENSAIKSINFSVVTLLWSPQLSEEIGSENKAGHEDPQSWLQVVLEVGTCPVNLIFFYSPIKFLVLTYGEFVMLTKTDQLREPEMFRVVQMCGTASRS